MGPLGPLGAPPEGPLGPLGASECETSDCERHPLRARSCCFRARFPLLRARFRPLARPKFIVCAQLERDFGLSYAICAHDFGLSGARRSPFAPKSTRFRPCFVHSLCFCLCLLVCLTAVLFVSVRLFLGVSGNILEHLGVSGSLWQHLGASRSIWESLGASGSIWESLAAPGSILEHLGIFCCAREFDVALA